LDRILRISRVTRSTKLVEWLASQLGGTFVPSPVPSVDIPRCVNAATRSVAVRMVDLLDEFTTAAADGVIDPCEAGTVRAVWDKTVSVVESTVAGAEQGHYR
jgi:hypothetical protein